MEQLKRKIRAVGELMAPLFIELPVKKAQMIDNAFVQQVYRHARFDELWSFIQNNKTLVRSGNLRWVIDWRLVRPDSAD